MAGHLALNPREARHDGRQPDGPGLRRRPACSNYPEAVKALEFVIDATPNADLPARTRSSRCSPTGPSRRARRRWRPTRRSRSRRRTQRKTLKAQINRPSRSSTRPPATSTPTSSGAAARPPARAQPLPFVRLAPVAQLAEQRTLNPKVEGSIPSGGTRKKPGCGRASGTAPAATIERPATRHTTPSVQVDGADDECARPGIASTARCPPTASIRSYMLRIPSAETLRGDEADAVVAHFEVQCG